MWKRKEDILEEKTKAIWLRLSAIMFCSYKNETVKVQNGKHESPALNQKNTPGN